MQCAPSAEKEVGRVVGERNERERALFQQRRLRCQEKCQRSVRAHTDTQNGASKGNPEAIQSTTLTWTHFPGIDSFKFQSLRGHFFSFFPFLDFPLT